jgi:hypothetical protein
MAIFRITQLWPTCDSLNQNLFLDTVFFGVRATVYTAKGAFQHHTVYTYSTPATQKGWKCEEIRACIIFLSGLLITDKNEKKN